MSTTTNLPLGRINVLAADVIKKAGWTQRREIDHDGSVCLTGALKVCSPQPGDWLIARAVYRHRDRAEEWNDADGRTKEEVINYLRSAKIVDEDIAEVFGPEWESIVALVRRAAVLTGKEYEAFYLWQDTPSRTMYEGWAEAIMIVRSVSAAQNRKKSETAVQAAAFDTGPGIAADAARALIVRDLIGWGGFTQTHYDTLTQSWAHIIGPVHPDDKRNS